MTWQILVKQVNRIKAQDDTPKKLTAAKSEKVSLKKVTKSSKVVKKHSGTPAKKRIFCSYWCIFCRYGKSFVRFDGQTARLLGHLPVR